MPSAVKRTSSGAEPDVGSANASITGAPDCWVWIVYVAVLTAPTLPAASVARCSSVCCPLPEIVTGPEYVVQLPLSSRYSTLSTPDPPAASDPASVTCTGALDVPPSGVAVEVGAVLSSLTVTV